MHIGPLCNCRISIELPNVGWSDDRKKKKKNILLTSWKASDRERETDKRKKKHKLLLWHSENVHVQSVGKLCQQQQQTNINRNCAISQMAKFAVKGQYLQHEWRKKSGRFFFCYFLMLLQASHAVINQWPSRRQCQFTSHEREQTSNKHNKTNQSA